MNNYLLENMVTFERKECPICKSKNRLKYINFPDIPIVKCAECGFLYSNTLISESVLNEYYKEHYGGKRHQQGQIINAKINAWAISQIIQLKSHYHLLDVGSGYGFLLKELKKQFSIECTGVELSSIEAKFAQETLGVDVKNCQLSDAGFPSNYYDVVSCFEVIEHISEPSVFVDELLKYLKDDGYLIIMTDNFESPVVKSLGSAFPKWIPHSHISHFSPTSLERLLREKNLRVVSRLSYTPWELHLSSLYYKIKGVHKTPEDSYNLVETLKSEMDGEFRLFWLRSLLNPFWVKLTKQNNLNQALMFIVAQKNT